MEATGPVDESPRRAVEYLHASAEPNRALGEVLEILGGIHAATGGAAIILVGANQGSVGYAKTSGKYANETVEYSNLAGVRCLSLYKPLNTAGRCALQPANACKQLAAILD